MIRRRSPRRGFTLVEILVAIALGVVLLGLAVAVSQSSAFASYKVVGAADRLSQWMLTAKSRALRDKAPRGIRLLTNNPANPNLVTEVAYIEQPDPWIPAANVPITANSPRLVVQRVVPQSTQPNDPMAGDTTRVFVINADTSAITTGDTLYLPEIGQSYVITIPATTGNPKIPPPQTGVNQQWPPLPTPPTNANVVWQMNSVVELQLSSPNDLGSRFGAGYAQVDTASSSVAATWHTTNFAVYRQPRVILGEPTQQLPAGMAVDLRASLNAPTTGNLDILFAPSGEIIGATAGVMALVVRDASIPNNLATIDLRVPNHVSAAGQVVLVCAYPRTGAISTQPNNPPPATTPPASPAPPPFDAFQFAKDGYNTGL